MANSNALIFNIGFMVVIVVFFYFMLIRPQKKKDAQIKQMRENLKVGDKIVSIGGIIGKIILIKEDYVVIESSSDKSKIELMKWGISSVVKNNKELKDKTQA